MLMTLMIQLKRVYDKTDITDGLRILVDRLWPRGVRRSTGNIDLWLKEVAPTNELRKWYAHDPKKWKRFKERYKEELKDNQAFDKLIDIALVNDPITLLYSASDRRHNNAVVLSSALKIRISRLRARLQHW